MTDTIPAAAIPTVTLNNGVQMPILGFGVYQVGPEEAESAVSAALAAGYRLIDTAAAYRNEEAVGAAIAKSGIPREELFITTKLWVQDRGEQNTIRAFEDSLTRLGLRYVDLYLIHQPFGDYYTQWRAMEQFNKDGRARAIGVSNFPADRLLDLIINNEITPAVNQIETNPFYQQSQYQQLMRDEGVQIESWGPFAEGKNGLFTNPLLSEIGAGHGKSVAQVVLRWLIQRDVVVIPKTVSPERMAQNLDVFDFTLSEQDMAAIGTLDEAASQFFDHRDPEMVRRLSASRLG
ncbi:MULTISPECIES: aldo/keto reductase [unclassified Microbacterium]|uniref:aldo/keto reductase n=1 Tax=unclassified Microbacterium TaxID=2609290 RepID=UPI00214B704C|nr:MULTISPECIES: aldo/keto reductase [unclassified Microbacterium]MCR2811205.1 aldo/keto reductase [Microbacterium sp. zg.B185]WIM19804.1 aldo/keto reductase [Microbacterium sp. zg-B185]